MRQLVLKIEERRYDLFIRFLKTLNYVQVVQPDPKDKKPTSHYDFSDLAGKLEWKGDAVLEQRRVRDEW